MANLPEKRGRERERNEILVVALLKAGVGQGCPIKNAQIQVGEGMVTVVFDLGSEQHLLGCLLLVVVYLNIFYFYLK